MQRSASEVEAANGALAHIGQPAIASLDEERAAARICRQRFADVRDALLRERDWNFAGAWVVPAKSPDPAVGPFKNRYPLPEDCIGIRRIEGLGTDQWAVEAAAINPGDDASQVMTLVCSIEAPSVHYTRRIENPALWDALFLDVFQLRLASAIAPVIARSLSLASTLNNRALERLGPAARRDAKERAPTKITRDTSWLASRGGYRPPYR